ncbi:alanine racemase [Aquibium sp. A9E412]|uniref:alanine racemase n=1 Tax=Aquibium sp. A9E412 TaxID=2976767 RepID=UPI0025B0C866|nr:alanine racemase [Aquibium sp. A9E412]MDN2567699.1 alanine racemase [Aquibium sp. A9E412]
MTNVIETARGSVAEPLAGGRLTIDLAALAENYRMLARLSAPAETAAVVKGDAYGIGIAHAVPALLAAGCRRFFVALPAEGAAVRRAAPDADIIVLNGLFDAETAAHYARERLIPVLNTQSDLALWEAHGWDGEVPRPCVIHVDTGMNRLGLTLERARVLAGENALTGALTPLLLMSHLACGDDAGHAMNRRQLEAFQAARALFPGVAASLANSAGIFLGEAYHFGLTRPGVALYGGAAVSGVANPMRPVVTAEARVVQVRRAAAGETVSYGAPRPLDRDTLIAVVAAGYADGYPRSASGAGVPLRDRVAAGAAGWIGGRTVPLLGRVTMDLTMFDVTDLGPDAVAVGDTIELFGPNMPIDAVAAAAGTIGYELLTGLGRRYHRRYTGEAG